MKRYASIATWCLVIGLGISTAAQAQSTTASSTTDSRLYAEIHGGPTLGHKSDSFFGGEAGWRLTPSLDIYVEGGRMGNVGTSKLDADAAVIAQFLGGSVSSASHQASYVDVGVRYQLDMIPVAMISKWHPYALVGVGVAHVVTDVAFEVGGNIVDPAQFGVQLGGDLTGSSNKTLIVAGAGVNIPFMNRFFADLGYRYGQILAKTGNVETDKGIKTQRIVLGVGVRF
jgi:opacity protein-like surface antigen